jgi:DNA-binding NarL/FixJ family response regulator
MSEPETINELKAIQRRLDAVIGLLFESVGRTDKFSFRDRIKALDSCGLTPTEIAKILQTSPNSVNVQMSLMRKESRKRASAKQR